MRKYAYYFILISIFMVSCAEEQKQEGITISGNFLNAKGKQIYFAELETDGIKNLDSLVVDEKGTFNFQHKPLDAGFYLVKTNSGENVLLMLEKNETVDLSADLGATPFDYQITGSPGSILLKEFYTQTFEKLSKADSLAAILRNLQGTPEFYELSVKLDPLFIQIVEEQQALERSFIAKHDTSLASLIVLNYKFGMLPVLTIDKDFDLYKHLDSTLSKSYPSNKHVVNHHNKVIEYQQSLTHP
jgi:hypothetical protein